MSTILIAIAIVIIIIAGVYVSSRGLPLPYTNSTKCTDNTQCSFPKTCNTANQTCVDLDLLGLLTAAQNAVATLFSTLTDLTAKFPIWYTKIDTSNALINANTKFVSQSMPDASGIKKDMDEASASIAEFIKNNLANPNCTAADISDCAYGNKIHALTISDDGAKISTVARLAVSIMDIPVTSSIGVVIDDMTNNYSIFRQITSLDTGIQKEINDGAISLQADITELINYRTTIQAQCANVVQTANTLYHHYIT
jgi:hypothetical protein